ncbi:MAG: hypothetical protein GY772_20305, partial [bacterium]|nr:hypothetical protein [bacterium]
MKVKLTDAEIVTHLDSITRPSVVAAVASARRRLALKSDGLTKAQAKLVTAAVDEARAAGLLIHRGKPISRCSVCDNNAGYKLRKRDTPAGRKGSPMYGKPLYLRGVELAERFVT